MRDYRPEEHKNIAAALVAAQAKLKNPPMDGKNPHFKSKFTTLLAARNAVAAPLAEAGITVTQSIGGESGGPTAGATGRLVCTTVLLHASGETIVSLMTVRPNKDDCQGWAAAATYARRLGLLAALNLVGEVDDDGEYGARKEEKPPRVKVGAKKDKDKRGANLCIPAPGEGSSEKEPGEAVKKTGAEVAGSSPASPTTKLTPKQVEMLQIARKAYAKREGKDPMEVRTNIFKKYGVTSSKDMTSAQLDEALDTMKEKE